MNMIQLPHYSLPTFASTTSNDDIYEIERVRSSYCNGVQSSLSRLDRLPNSLKPGVLKAEKEEHTRINLESHVKKDFKVKSVSKYEGFSSFAYILEGNITNSINKQLKVASKPFVPTSSSFQKGKHRELLADKSYNAFKEVISEKQLKKYSKLIKKPNTTDSDIIHHATAAAADDDDNDDDNKIISTPTRQFSSSLMFPKSEQRPEFEPLFVRPISSALRRNILHKQKINLSSRDGRPDMTSKNQLLPDIVTERIFDRYHSLFSSSSSSRLLQSQSRQNHPSFHYITNGFEKTNWIHREYYQKLLSKWSLLIKNLLFEDWSHLNVKIKSEQRMEIIILFNITSVVIPINTLMKYMDYFESCGLGYELGLTRRPKRWGVIEYDQDVDQTIDQDNHLLTRDVHNSEFMESKETLVFSLLAPWAVGHSTAVTTRTLSRGNTSIKNIYR